MGPAPNRGYALYSGGATVALTFPPGYRWADFATLQFLNDVGVAMAVAQRDSAAGTNGGLRPVVWQDGTAKPIPLPMTPDDCALRFNNLVPPFSQESFNVYRWASIASATSSSMPATRRWDVQTTAP